MGLRDIPRPEGYPRGLPPPNRLQRHIHGPYATRRNAVIAALYLTGFPAEQKWATRLAECCSTAGIYFEPENGNPRPWLARCHSRLCSFCGRGRRRNVAEQLHQLVKRMEEPKHIVLTRKSRTTSLREQLDEFRVAFAKLRRDPQWKSRCKGGVYTLEIKRNPDTGTWHPHAHVIADMTYIPQKMLARIWSKYMPGGHNVWIRQVTSSKNAAWEISKYVGTPPPSDAWPAKATVEFARATHGVRMLQSFGNCHGKAVTADQEAPAKKPDALYIPIPAVAYLASTGIPVAQDLAALMWSRWPFLRSYLEEYCPESIHCDRLQTNDVLTCPRPPPIGEGRYGPLTDPDAQARLDNSLHLTCLLWLGMRNSGDLELPSEPEEE